MVKHDGSQLTLQELVQGLTTAVVPPIPVTGIACHSKQVRTSELFVAVHGPHHDGHAFLGEAVRRGACAVVVERPPAEPCACPVILVDDTKPALRVIASRWYGDPARHLRFIGVTGTNGKTTTTYLIKTILDAAGHRVGLLGTVVYEIGGRQVPSVNTTPGVLELQRLFAEMVEQGLSWCAMEVSSHALDQGRIEGVQFEAAIFTNLGSDHLDYHGTLERYAAAKRRLFGYLRPGGRAVINMDDPYGQTLVEALNSQSVLTYGIEPDCRLIEEKDSARASRSAPQVVVRGLTCSWEGMSLVLESPRGTLPLHTPLVGRHNVLNLTAASATCLALGVSPAVIQRAVGGFPQVPGRMERIPNDAGILAVVDYAHTADALRLVLLSLRELVRGRVIVVFGCGGDRDQTKRPAMGRVASLLADEVVLTSDNPRREDPLDIAHQIKAGFEPGFRDHQVVVDREQAIVTALSMAKSDDVVLIAGKGHEVYQVFDHVTVPFSDRAVVERYCATRQSVAI